MSRPATDVKDVGAFFFIENEDDEMKCAICNEITDNYIIEPNGDPYYYCLRCENEELYPDESLNEVSMGRFDDDPPEHM